MKNQEKRFSINENEYKGKFDIIKSLLTNRDEVMFAYLHGSFQNKTNFGDVDVALYLTGVPEKGFLQYELDFEQEMEAVIKLPVDIRVLNNAPPSFKYSAIKNGIRLVDSDEDARVEFETTTFKLYFDFLPYRQQYLREALEIEV